jgi:putative Holliday junction resolvase
MLARPWKTIAREGGPEQVAATLAREARELMGDEDSLAAIVVGLPRRLNGEPNEQTPIVEGLVARLRPLVTVPVLLQDERLSSREAESLLARREKSWRKRRETLDQTSAAVILQDYLDSRPAVDPGGHGA